MDALDRMQQQLLEAERQTRKAKRAFKSQNKNTTVAKDQVFDVDNSLIISQIPKKRGVMGPPMILEATNNLPIVKRSRQAIWALIDVIEIYSNVNVRCPDGQGKIVAIDKTKNSITVKTRRTTKAYPAKNVKLMLRPLTQIMGRNLNVITNLALGVDGFSYQTKRDGKKISCIGKAYTVEIFLKPDFAIRVFDAKGNAKEARNLGYIMTYLIMREYDLINLLRTPYALIASGVPQI